MWNSGYEMDDRVTFVERLVIQELLLDEHENFLRSIKEDMITDRTPLDILSYLLISMDDTHSGLLDPRVDEFKMRVLRMMAEHFTHIVIVPPGIEYEKIEGKIGRCFSTRLFQQTLTDLMVGSVFRNMKSFGTSLLVMVVDDKMTDFDERVKDVTNKIKHSIPLQKKGKL